MLSLAEESSRTTTTSIESMTVSTCSAHAAPKIDNSKHDTILYEVTQESAGSRLYDPSLRFGLGRTSINNANYATGISRNIIGIEDLEEIHLTQQFATQESAGSRPYDLSLSFEVVQTSNSILYRQWSVPFGKSAVRKASMAWNIWRRLISLDKYARQACIWYRCNW